MNKMFKQTALTSLDSYKLGHADQYAEGTQYVFSNFTPRSNRLFSGKENESYDGKIVVAGIRMLVTEIHHVFKNTFFDLPVEEVEVEEDVVSEEEVNLFNTEL